MNLKKALRILGLQQPVSLDEIEEKHRQLAKNHHPHKSGDDEMMQELNVARDVIRASLNNQALIPFSTVQDLIKASNSEIQQRQEIREDVTSITQQMKQTSFNKVKKLKDLIVLVGAVSVAVAFFGQDILPKELSGTNSWYGIILLFVGIYAAVTYWLLNERVRKCENDIEPVCN